MAQQDHVRVLVPNEMTDELRGALDRIEGATITSVSISAPDPATYRGETAGAVQVAKEDEPDDLPDETVQVEPDDVSDLRVVTIVVPHGRDAVKDFLAERSDVQLLDAWRPKVDEGPGPPA